ncbi:CD82 antigen [Nothobranchius furzeri]|uniref:Tetraspanin n=1 Tax=Nothobranchius furzeri TaxID=105023 RepID=A0A8C6KW77_NOTFU|nr:CD82 antigen [Nothobranchius furzeri]KAF7226491.1 CD82 antigen-like [Nothobranchius furzeri]
MKLELKIELLKFCFSVLNSIFLILGLSVGGCALWILFDTGTFLYILSSEEMRVVAVGLLMIGGVVMLVSMTGCAAAICERRFLLLVYVVFVIVLILGQLFVSLLLLINRKKIEQSLTETVDKIISEYGDDTNAHSRLLDNVQHYAKCCGRTGPADWMKNSFIQNLNLTSPEVLPCSCFRSYHLRFTSSWCSENISFTEPQFGRGNGTFDQNCSQKLNYWLQENILTIIGMDVGLILLQLALISISVSLFQMFGRKVVLKRTSQLIDEADDHPDSTPDDLLDCAEQNYAYMGPDADHTRPPLHDPQRSQQPAL